MGYLIRSIWLSTSREASRLVQPNPMFVELPRCAGLIYCDSDSPPQSPKRWFPAAMTLLAWQEEVQPTSLRRGSHLVSTGRAPCRLPINLDPTTSVPRVRRQRAPVKRHSRQHIVCRLALDACARRHNVRQRCLEAMRFGRVHAGMTTAFLGDRRMRRSSYAHQRFEESHTDSLARECPSFQPISRSRSMSSAGTYAGCVSIGGFHPGSRRQRCGNTSQARSEGMC